MNTHTRVSFGMTSSYSEEAPTESSAQTEASQTGDRQEASANPTQQESANPTQQESANPTQQDFAHPNQAADSFVSLEENHRPQITIRSEERVTSSEGQTQDVIPTDDIIGKHNLRSKKHIIFVDLDNKQSFFSRDRFDEVLAMDQTARSQPFFWVVCNTITNDSLSKPNGATGETYEYHLLKLIKMGLAYKEIVGHRPNAADFRIVVRVTELDEFLPKDIELFVLSSDRSFHFLTNNSGRFISHFHDRNEATISYIIRARRVDNVSPMPNESTNLNKQDFYEINTFTKQVYFSLKVPNKLQPRYMKILQEQPDVKFFLFFREITIKTRNPWYTHFQKYNQLWVIETPKDQKDDVPLMELIACVTRMHHRLHQTVKFIILSDQLQKADLCIPNSRSIVIQQI